MRFHAFVIGLQLAALLAAAAAAQPPAAPKVEVQLALERAELKAGGETTVDLWLFNPSGQALAAGQLYLLTPKHLEVRREGCAGEPLAMPVVAPALAPGALVPVHLCLKAGRRVREGSALLNVLVKYDGAWAEGQRSTMVTVQRELKVGLFGTETVAGVSLSLLALLLPGALLLWAAGAGEWKGPVERGTVSVLLSILIAWAVSPWVGSAGLGLISAWSFLAMCGLGLAIGLVVRKVSSGVKRRRTKQHELGPGDSTAATLRKLIEKNPEATAPRTTLTNDKDAGDAAVGSLAERDVDGGWVIAGYFTIRPKADGSVTREQLEKARRKGQLALARLAERKEEELDWVSDDVSRPDGTTRGTAIEELPGSYTRVRADQGGRAVLVVAPEVG